MTWFTLLPPELLVYAGAAIAAIVGFFTYGASKKREGKKELEHEHTKDKARREAAGRDALREGRDSGLSPADRVRRNDGDWRGM